MGWTVEAALQLLLERLGPPRSSVLLSAGGKAEILAADLPNLDTRLADLRAELDAWMIEHWQGDLALVLAVGPAFAAEEFLRHGKNAKGEAVFVAEGYRQEREKLAAALDAAKLAPFATWSGAAGLVGSGVIPAPFEERAEGACASCGVRPAVVQSPLDGVWRCQVCDAAYWLGQSLPHADGLALLERQAEAEGGVAALPGGLRLVPGDWRGPQALVSVTFARENAGSAVFRPPAYVPRIEEPADPRDDHAGVEPDERGAVRDLMSFAQIAARALEVVEGRILGRDLLGIIKADVDRLGKIFSCGLGRDRSPARIAQLSRLLDGYFAERLPWLLAREFPATYTVYAGGDDLLLVAPWRDALPLALRLREDFGAFAGGNPNLTLSAGIAFVHPKHPLALAAEEADAALDEAKAKGRNRLGVFDRCLSWEAARATLELAEALNTEVRAGTLPPTFLHRMRWFAARRSQAEGGAPRAADWNAKWQYHKARFLDRCRGTPRDRLDALLLRALPPPTHAAEADLEIAMTIALWRNR
jgi:CRISPR-associated protein Csm1